MTFWTQPRQKPAAPVFLEDYGSGLGLSAALEEGWVNNPVMGAIDAEQLDYARRGAPQPVAGYRGSAAPGRLEPDSVIMEPAEANHWFGIEGELSFDRPVRAREAQLLHDWKKAEVKRRDILARADPGFLPGAARFGASFAAQALDPLNIAASFIPIVGEARYARMLQLAGTSLGRAGVRVGVGAAEGAVGAALVEPLVFAGAKARGQDYDLWDSLMNVGIGTVLGGGLHVALGGVGDALRARGGAAKDVPAGEQLVRDIGQPAHQANVRGAIAALAEERPVRVADALDIVDPRTKVPEYRADPADVAGSIERFVARVQDVQDHAYLRVGEVAPATVAAARQAGFDIAGYNLVIQGDDVRHALATHGGKVPADEVPLTPAHIARVPEIVANPDSVTAVKTNRGLPGLEFRKRDGDIQFVVQEIRDRKQRLSFKTMWIKRPGGSDRYGPDGNPDQGGSGGLDRSDAPAEPQTARPERGPSGAGDNLGQAAPEYNPADTIAPDPEVAAAIDRLEGEVAGDLGRVETTEDQIAALEAELGELQRLTAGADAADLKTAQADEVTKAAAAEAKAYEQGAICLIGGDV